MVMEGRELVRDEVLFSTECYESIAPKRKGVLRTVRGPVAEWGNLNRNNRKYTETLWDKVLNSDYVAEQKQNKTLYGEANHPENRFEVDFSRVSHNIVEMYKVPDKQEIHAEIDILDTPLGNILNVLYDYGSGIGYSSRAGGVLRKKKDFVEVDEDSYSFITFDAVPFPSVKIARPGVNESGLENNEKVELSEEAHKNILEIINESSKKDKEVIKDFIYSIRDYNLDRELTILEGLEGKETDVAETLKDTSLCLLKESYRQLSILKTEKSLFESKLLGQKSEISKYKEELEASLQKIKEINEGAKENKVLEKENEELKSKVWEVSEKNNSLLNTIKNYEESLDDIELNLLEKEVLNEENKALKITIENLKCAIAENTQNTLTNELLKEQVEDMKRFSDYDLIVDELSGAVKEITALKESYNFSLSELANTKEELKSVNENLCSLTSDIESLTSEKVELQESLDDCNNELSKANESISTLSSEMQIYEGKLTSYKEELINSICGNYGVAPNDVVSKLSKDFTSSDLHILCESFEENSEVELISISEDVVIDEDSEKELSIKEQRKAKLGGMFTSSRRGINIKN